MSYLQKNNKRESRVRVFIIRIIVICVVLTGLVGLFRQPLFNLSYVVVYPASLLRPYTTSVREYVYSFFTANYVLQEKVNQLESRLRMISDEKQILESEKRFSETWERIADSASTSVRFSALTPVRVTIRPPYTPYDTIVISYGGGEIASGTRVYGIDRLLPIGRVEYSYKNESKVRLFSSPGESFVATIGTSTEQWLAEGRGGGLFEINIPRTQSILIGDPVFLPRESTIVYSVVEDIVSRDSDPFQTVRFFLPVPFRSMDIVAIPTQS